MGYIARGGSGTRCKALGPTKRRRRKRRRRRDACPPSLPPLPPEVGKEETKPEGRLEIYPAHPHFQSDEMKNE